MVLMHVWVLQAARKARRRKSHRVVGKIDPVKNWSVDNKDTRSEHFLTLLYISRGTLLPGVVGQFQVVGGCSPTLEVEFSHTVSWWGWVGGHNRPNCISRVNVMVYWPPPSCGLWKVLVRFRVWLHFHSLFSLWRLMDLLGRKTRYKPVEKE